MTAEQGVRDSEHAGEASGAVPDPPEQEHGVAGLVQRVTGLRPVRSYLHYANDNGPLIASGMTYQAIFALFAALWFTFSVGGFVVRGNTELQRSLFGAINGFVPGLIAYGKGSTGVLPASTLLRPDALGVSSAISLVGVLLTAVGFLATLRTGIRILFDLPNLTGNPVLLKLKDLGYTVAFGAVVLLTAAISVISNTVLSTVLGLLGLENTPASQLLASAVSFVLIAAIDVGIVAAVLRILSGIPIPARHLWGGAILGGVGLAVLQTLGTSLLGGARSNPVIATFATLVGVLLYFNFVSQVILIAASWIALRLEDARIDARGLSPQQAQVQKAEEIEKARRLLASANRDALQQRVRQARGVQRWRLARELRREVRAEARRQRRVPTVSEYRKAQQVTGDTAPDTQQIAVVTPAAAEGTDSGAAGG